MTAWNFLPFLLKRVRVAPAWAVRVAFAVWFAGLAALGATFVRLRSATKNFDSPARADRVP